MAFSLPAAAQTEPRIATLSANGAGSVSVVPDIAIVTIGVVSREATAREALDINNARLAEVIAAIRSAGVADKDIATSGFSVSPIHESRPRPAGSDEKAPRIFGYEVRNDVRVTIRDIADAGETLDKVVTAGANQIGSIQFDVSDRDTPADEALKRAIAEATRQAEIMAAAAGVDLVRVLDINASGGAPTFARMEMRAASDGVPVMPGERQVTANANMAWEIAPR